MNFYASLILLWNYGIFYNYLLSCKWFYITCRVSYIFVGINYTHYNFDFISPISYLDEWHYHYGIFKTEFSSRKTTICTVHALYWLNANKRPNWALYHEHEQWYHITNCNMTWFFSLTIKSTDTSCFKTSNKTQVTTDKPRLLTRCLKTDL